MAVLPEEDWARYGNLKLQSCRPHQTYSSHASCAVDRHLRHREAPPVALGEDVFGERGRRACFPGVSRDLVARPRLPDPRWCEERVPLGNDGDGVDRQATGRARSQLVESLESFFQVLQVPPLVYCG